MGAENAQFYGPSIAVLVHADCMPEQRCLQHALTCAKQQRMQGETGLDPSKDAPCSSPRA